jgi:hypothetical protein
MKWQLAGTWLIGSVVTGTIAVVLTSSRGDLPFRPLALLPGSSLLTVFLLFCAMFVALFALGWRTENATWLPNEARAAILWTVLVGGGGLVGWSFAAAVTFDVGFGLGTQLTLAYLGGGLPFALIAAMLARPLVLNGVAAALTAIALLVGVIMMDAPIQTCVRYLQLLVGPVVTGW